MAAGVGSSYSGAPPARQTGMGRTGMAVFGVAAVIVGGILIFNPYAAVRTLALLLGLSLVVGGLLEIAAGWDSGRRWSSMVLGGLLLLGGLLTAFWPGVTLWTLAVLTGLSLLVHGLTRIALAFAGRAEIPHWGWVAAAGAVNVVFGILVLTWPGATIVVLSLILGFQILAFGVVLLVSAFSGSRSPQAAGA